jgi:AsmA protein
VSTNQWKICFPKIKLNNFGREFIMKRLLRSLVIFTLLFFFLAAITLIAITQFVNPNQFKTEIQDLVGKKTGRELSIGGNIHWTFYPWLGLEINDLALQNPPSFEKTPFAKLSKIGFKVNLIPLLRGQIRISSIQLSGLELYLSINKKGQSNWEDLSQKQTRTTASNSLNSAESSPSSPPIDISIEQLRFDNTTIDFDNQLTSTRILIQNAALSARQIQTNEAFPLKGKMQISVFPAQIQDAVSFKGLVLCDLAKTTISLRDVSIDQTITLPQHAPIQETLQLTSDFNWRQGWAIIDPIQGTIGDTTIAGNLHFTNLQTNPLVQGHFSAQNLALGELKISNLEASLKGQQGILSFSPVIATLYKGTLKNETTVNLKQTTYQTSGQFDGIQLADLLQDTTGKNDVAGETQGTYSLKTQGTDLTEWTNHLQGQVGFQINEGHIKGIDLEYVFAEAKALIKGQKNQKTDTHNTAFGKLSGTIQAQNGILYNQDLKLSSPKFLVTGKGTYELPPRNRMDYYAETKLNESDDHESTVLFKNLPLGIYITGQPPELHYRPDFEKLFQSILQAQAQKQSAKILNKLHQDLGGDLGEGAQDAMQRGLGDALKNLPFKDILNKNQ